MIFKIEQCWIDFIQGDRLIKNSLLLFLPFTLLPISIDKASASEDTKGMSQINSVRRKMGVSHDANEYTSPEQYTQGANVLLQILIRLGKI